jgi:hypothetical protein
LRSVNWADKRAMPRQPAWPAPGSRRRLAPAPAGRRAVHPHSTCRPRSVLDGGSRSTPVHARSWVRRSPDLFQDATDFFG